MAEAAERRHHPANAAAQQGRTAPCERAVVGKRLGETHADASADRRGEADEKSRPIGLGRESRREQRRQRRDRTIHQAGEAGLHILQHEHAVAGFVLLLDGGLGERGGADTFGDPFVTAFHRREIA